MADDSSSSDEEVDFKPQHRQQTKTLQSKPQAKILATSSQIYHETRRLERTCGKSDTPLVLEPSSVQFTCVEPGALYVMTFSVQNLTRVAQRVRIQPPKTRYFALNFIPAGTVAPGHDIRAEIECQLPEGAPDLLYTDSVKVIMGPHTIDLPLLATKAHARVVFEPFLDFGFVAEDHYVKADVRFQNVGEATANITLQSKTDGRAIIFSTSKFDIAPTQSQTVTLTLKSKTLGVLRDLIDVIVGGGIEHGILDVNAHIVEQKLTIISPEKRATLDNIKFGTIFFGEKRSFPALLVNSGPLPMSFSISYGDEDPQLEDDQSVEKCIAITPADGVIRPFQQVPIVIHFKPEVPIPGSGFTKKFLEDMKEPMEIIRLATVECVELGLKVPLSIQGKAAMPSVVVKPNVLRFGDCPVNDHRDILLEVTNTSSLAAVFNFAPTAHFKVSPSSGSVAPGLTLSLIATFHPAQLGDFKDILEMKFANLRSVTLKAFGHCTDVGSKKTLVGGINKVSDDFVVEPKFVDPVVVVETRRVQQLQAEKTKKRAAQTLRTMTHGELNFEEVEKDLLSLSISPSQQFRDPHLQGSISASSFRSSQMRDIVYGTHKPSAGTVQDVNEEGEKAGPSHPWTMKKKHDAAYTNYVKQSHLLREEKREQARTQRLTMRGANERNNPFGVDMGMERGLDEPHLPVPKANERLWLASNVDGGGRSRKAFDENRLIMKKYPEAPSTQAEVRDCTAELSVEELALITGSQKVINFDKVCLGSSSSKNFMVFNDSEQSVLVRVMDLDSDLRQSRPGAQVIPSKTAAGFDITFSSKALGDFKKTFNWTINGLHTFKVLVTATVVPIELVLSRDNLVLEFAEDSLEASVHQTITLHNPGNAQAEYLWGSVGAFECRPGKGTIAPGQTAVIDVAWTPESGLRNDEELGLHVVSGVDQTLKVSGNFYPAQLEFVRNHLNMNQLAVGMLKTFKTQLRNTGTSPAVFFITPCDEKYHISVKPNNAVVFPGEVLDLMVSVTPSEPMSYNRAAIKVQVRGGALMALKLEGQSIVPDVNLLETEFAFGEVCVGSEWRVPMTLVNDSPISACIILDLNRYPDFQPCITNDDAPAKPFQEDDFGNQISLLPIDPNLKIKKSNSWEISVGPGSTLAGCLVFIPSQVRQHTFKTNMFLKGIKEIKKLERDASAEGAPSRLSIASNVVDFGDRVVSRDPLARTTYYLEFAFSNVASQGFAYEIRERVEALILDEGAPPKAGAMIAAPSPTPGHSKPHTSAGAAPGHSAPGHSVAQGSKGKTPLPSAFSKMLGAGQKDNHDDMAPKPPSFFVSPLRGDIAAGQSVPIRVTFQPQDNVNYSKKLDVFLTGQPDPTRPYLTLTCKGTGAFPRLRFSKQHVQLPSVPLGVTSRATFDVYNEGYGSLQLRYRVSPTIPVALDLVFPDGDFIGLSIERVSVIVSAKSESPVAWSGKVEFYDSDGDRFHIYVSGCSDCCLLTNYPFVKAYTGPYNFVGVDDQPVRFLPKEYITAIREQEMKRREQMRKQRQQERLAEQAAKENPNKSITSKKSEKSASPTKAAKTPKQPELVIEGLVKEGVDLEGDGIAMMQQYQCNDLEAQALLKWLNKMICRKPFDESRFPECITESYGDLAIDCIEQMSGRKIVGVKPGAGEGCDGQSPAPNLPSSNASQSSQGSSHPPQPPSSAPPATPATPATPGSPGRRQSSHVSRTAAKAAMAIRLVGKYRIILEHLIRNGCLLNHLDPISLLGKEEYLIAQENELKRSEGMRLTPSILKDKVIEWDRAWATDCKSSWMDVLFQAIKVFSLSRATYKVLAGTPGTTVLGSGAEETAVAVEAKPQPGKKVKKAPPFPPEFSASNVYTHSEAVLLAWAAYHIQHAGNLKDEGVPDNAPSQAMVGLNRRITDVDAEFNDLFGFCQVFHSHLPDATSPDQPLYGYSIADKLKRDEMFKRVDKIMRHTRLHFDISEEQLCSSGRVLLLYLLHLFLGLPNLIPKSEIEFKGLLATPVCKMIELKNPSNKRVVYEVSLRGSGAFSIGVKDIVIPPESIVQVPVTLNAKFSDPVSASVTFWGMREGGTAGSTMVFKLLGNITGRLPQETITRKVNLFDTDTIQLRVRNPFDRDGLFPIVLEVDHEPVALEDVIGGSRARKRVDHLLAPKPDDTEYEEIYKIPFWTNDKKIQVNADSTQTLTLNVLPFVMGTYTCRVILIDPFVGEFCYEIVTEVGMPKALERLDITAEEMKDGRVVKKLMRLQSKNIAFEKAVAYAAEVRMLNPSKRVKVRSTLYNLLASNPIDNEKARYTIDILSPYFSTHKDTMFLGEYLLQNQPPSTAGTSGGKDRAQTSKAKKGIKTLVDDAPADESTIGFNACIFTFKPQKAGAYQARIVAYASDNKCDVRVLDLVANVTMPPSNMSLEFSAPARQAISQDFPITNTSDKLWNLSITITGDAFTGPKVVVVPAGETVDVPITFCGKSVGVLQGTMVLKNAEAMLDTFNVKLVGVVEEPLAENHLVFKCKAREKKTFSVPLQRIVVARPKSRRDAEKPVDKKEGVKKKGGKEAEKEREPSSDSIPHDLLLAPQIFSVQTDLDFISGASEVTLRKDEGTYDFTVMSPASGIFSGSITFIDKESGSMMWYTMDIEVTAPGAERNIEVGAMVRKAAAVEISLENPVKESIQFSVAFEGDGLIGDATYTLPSQTSSMGVSPYELIYSPLFAGNFTGRISFYNEKVGEFWYKLILTGYPAPPTQIDMVECMVGCTETISIPIENPLTEEVSLEVRISDPEHFSVQPDVVTLGPYAQSSFNLSFRPSSLSEIVQSDVYLSHPSFGEVQYKVSGKGLMPGIMPTTDISAPLGEISSHTIIFRNPFPHPLPVDFILNEGQGKEAAIGGEVFQLLLRKSTDLVIPAKSSFPCGVSFSPKRLGQYQNNVQVRSSMGGLNLLWYFPIVGMAESTTPMKLPRMMTQCKTSILKDIDVPLEGLMRRDLAPGEKILATDFTVEIVCDPRKKLLVDRSFRAQPLELVESVFFSSESAGPSSPRRIADYIMRYRLLFEPLRTFATPVEIVISCKSKGRWRLQLELDSSDPDPDDTIHLCAAIGSADKVSFRLSNRFLGFSSFEAYFTAHSSPHLSVTPATGVLAPFGSEGTPFVVGFSPLEYGAVESGTLVIATEDAQWNYRIEGSYPKSLGQKLSSVKSKISTR